MEKVILLLKHIIEFANEENELDLTPKRDLLSFAQFCQFAMISIRFLSARQKLPSDVIRLYLMENFYGTFYRQ